MDVERDFGTNRREIRKRGHGDGDVIADAARVDDGLVGVLGQKLSAQMGNHSQAIVAAERRWTLSEKRSRTSRELCRLIPNMRWPKEKSGQKAMRTQIGSQNPHPLAKGARRVGHPFVL